MLFFNMYSAYLDALLYPYIFTKAAGVSSLSIVCSRAGHLQQMQVCCERRKAEIKEWARQEGKILLMLFVACWYCNCIKKESVEVNGVKWPRRDWTNVIRPFTGFSTITGLISTPWSKDEEMWSMESFRSCLGNYVDETSCVYSLKFLADNLIANFLFPGFFEHSSSTVMSEPQVSGLCCRWMHPV